MFETSIVILNWNGIDFLKKFIPILIKHSSLPDVEIVVADNASTDDSVNFLKTNFPSIRLILHDKNYGFAEGYNKALSVLSSKYFIILNSDVEVTEGWLSPLIDTLRVNDDVAAVMPKIRNYYRRDYFEYAGAAGGFIDKYGYPFCRGRVINYVEKDSGQYDSVREVFWATGACMAIKSYLFFNAGGFDPMFFAHMEEIDLCWRLQLMGYKLMCVPDSIVYHVGGGALPKENPYKTYLNFRNNLFLLYKNLHPARINKIFLIRIFLDLFIGFTYLFKGQFKFFSAIFRAYIDFFKHLPELKKYRNNNLKLISRQINLNNTFPHSILFKYLLDRVKFTSFFVNSSL